MLVCKWSPRGCYFTEARDSQPQAVASLWLELNCPDNSCPALSFGVVAEVSTNHVLRCPEEGGV